MTRLEALNFIGDFLEEIDREDLALKLYKLSFDKLKQVAKMIDTNQKTEQIELEILVSYINADSSTSEENSDGSNVKYSVELEHNDVY